MRYAYHNDGVMSWRGTSSPRQTRAADSVSLGSLGGDTTLGMPLPRAGAPEPMGACCSSCASGVGEFAIPGGTKTMMIGVALATYLLFFRKRRRR